MRLARLQNGSDFRAMRHSLRRLELPAETFGSMTERHEIVQTYLTLPSKRQMLTTGEATETMVVS